MGYTIKEVAEKLNISQYTLRYYDKEGLIPYLKREKNGIRRYWLDKYDYIFKKYWYANYKNTWIYNIISSRG